jgi:hypothetical protein
MPRPTLYISQILAWVDAYRKKWGEWPNMYSGYIPGTLEDNWRRIDSALRIGLRGLPGGSSLARFLYEHRGVRNLGCLPRLTSKQILGWADAYHERHGRWPTTESGPIDNVPGETWKGIDYALRTGMRGLKGKTSLSRLLTKQRRVRNIQNLPRLTETQILAWSDAHYRRTGVWPTSKSGTIPKTMGDTWSGVNTALKIGRRGLPGGSSLPRLLERERGVRNAKHPPRLSVPRILAWADAYYERTGIWPSRNSGPIAEAPGETWAMIDRALRKGQRGLKGTVSLFRLLVKHRKISIRLTDSIR